jgi:cysteine desulfurase
MKHYLDYNATAPMRPEVVEKMAELQALPLNPSSVHGAGRHAKKLLEDARAQIAQHLSLFPNEVIFTASGTEANNMVLNGFAGRKIFISATEHASIYKAAGNAVKIPVDMQGVLDLVALDRLLVEHKDPALVSVILANNETGVIQPIEEIAKIVHAHNGLLHTDAVQAVGKMPLDFGKMGVDMMSISAHKCGGPVGVGALIMKSTLAIKPLLAGGGQELGRRAGTENIPAIVGFAESIERSFNNDWQQIELLRNLVENGLQQLVPDIVVFGQKSNRLCNTSSIAMPGVSNEVQLMHFDLAGIAVSAGSACSSGRVEPSHVLAAMGVSTEQASTVIRASLGWASSEVDVKAFVNAWKSLYEKRVLSAA